MNRKHERRNRKEEIRMYFWINWLMRSNENFQKGKSREEYFKTRKALNFRLVNALSVYLPVSLI